MVLPLRRALSPERLSPGLLLPVALGLVTTAVAVAPVPVLVTAGLELAAPYLVGRLLPHAPLGRLLLGLQVAHLVAAVAQPTSPAWWPLALLPVALTFQALPLSVGQLHEQRARGEDVDDLRARVGAIVTVLAISAVGLLVFMANAQERLEQRASAVRFQVQDAMSVLDRVDATEPDLSEFVARLVDAPLVRSSWDGRTLHVAFEVRLGLLPTHCVTASFTEGSRSNGLTHLDFGPCR